MGGRPLSGDRIENLHALLHQFKHRYVDHIGGRNPVLGDQDGIFGFGELGQHLDVHEVAGAASLLRRDQIVQRQKRHARALNAAHLTAWIGVITRDGPGNGHDIDAWVIGDKSVLVSVRL